MRDGGLAGHGGVLPGLRRRRFRAGPARVKPARHRRDPGTKPLAPPPGAIFRISWTSCQESRVEFTPRELGVLRLVAHGRSPLEIAGQLGLHRVAVTLTVRKLAAKVGANSMADLGRKARAIN